MNVLDYIVNKEDQFLGSNEEKEQHHTYFMAECIIGAGLVLSSMLTYDPIAIPAAIVIADAGVRLRRDAYAEKPT